MPCTQSSSRTSVYTRDKYYVPQPPHDPGWPLDLLRAPLGEMRQLRKYLIPMILGQYVRECQAEACVCAQQAQHLATYHPLRVALPFCVYV